MREMEWSERKFYRILKGQEISKAEKEKVKQLIKN